MKKRCECFCFLLLSYKRIRWLMKKDSSAFGFFFSPTKGSSVRPRVWCLSNSGMRFDVSQASSITPHPLCISSLFCINTEPIYTLEASKTYLGLGMFQNFLKLTRSSFLPQLWSGVEDAFPWGNSSLAAKCSYPDLKKKKKKKRIKALSIFCLFISLLTFFFFFPLFVYSLENLLMEVLRQWESARRKLPILTRRVQVFMIDWMIHN